MEYCLSVTDGSEEPEAYWVNTSGNDIITLFTKNSIEANDGDNIQKLQDLMDGKSVLIKLSEFSVYPDIKQGMSFDTFCTMMLQTGYVTFDEKLQDLMDGKSVLIKLSEFSVYPDIKQGMSFDTFCTMMLQTGYVTFDENSKLKGMVSVKIPNHEVRQAFETKFSCLYSNDNDVWKDEGFKLLDAMMSNDIDMAQAIINAVLATYISIRHSGSEQYYHGDVWKDEGFKLLDAMMSNDIDMAQAIINAVLATYISIRHSGSEQYYHGLMQGLLLTAAQKKRVKVLDESESGIGYSDIILKDFMHKRAVILEFKRAGDEDLCLRTANEATQVMSNTIMVLCRVF